VTPLKPCPFCPTHVMTFDSLTQADHDAGTRLSPAWCLTPLRGVISPRSATCVAGRYRQDRGPSVHGRIEGLI